MKKLLVLLLLLPLGAFAQDSLQLSAPQREAAKAVAKQWVTELTKAQDIDLLVGISAVPFNLDGNKMLSTLDEVKEIYLKIKANKGERTLPPVQAKIGKIENPEGKPQLINVLISFAFEDKQQMINVEVVAQKGVYKVCGFTD